MQTFIAKKEQIYNSYVSLIDSIEGLSISKVPEYASNNHWINVLNIDNKKYQLDKESIMIKLEEHGIQTRPVWKLNHLQKPYNKFQSFKIDNAFKLVVQSLCLPSSLSLLEEEINKIAQILNG